jgi:hypothetical protein
MRLSPLGTSAMILFAVPVPNDDSDDGECGAVDGMIGKSNRSTWRNPAPVSLCLPQIPYDLVRPRIRAAPVGSHCGKPATNFLRYGRPKAAAISVSTCSGSGK